MTDAEPISEVTWAEWKQAQAHLKEMGVTFSLTGPDADAALGEIERLRSQANEGPILAALRAWLTTPDAVGRWVDQLDGSCDFMPAGRDVFAAKLGSLVAESAQQAAVSERGCGCQCVESCAVDCTALCVCQSAQEAASAPSTFNHRNPDGSYSLSSEDHAE